MTHVEILPGKEVSVGLLSTAKDELAVMADSEKKESDVPPTEPAKEQIVTPWTVKAAEGSEAIDYDKLISKT